MRSSIIIFLLMILLSSCDETSITYYRYQDMAVTRIDKEGRTAFYYGIVPDTSKESDAAIIGSYPRGHDMMVACLEFKEAGQINLISIEGDFSVPQKHPLLNLINYSTDEFRKWQKETDANFSNITRIDRVWHVERRVDSIYKSKVRIEHVD